MNDATVGHNTRFRKELLDRLLCKKVTFQDVKRHVLSQQEMDYLHLNDILPRREYIGLVRKGGYSKQAAYNKWRRVVKESIKDFDPKPYSNMIIALKRSGDDTSVLEMWLRSRCNGGIPAKEILTVKDYVVDLLGGVRDGLYEKKTLRICEVARKLEVSVSYIKRLTKDGTLKKEDHGLISDNQVTDYLRQEAVKGSNCYLNLLEKLIKNKDSSPGELSDELFGKFDKIERCIRFLKIGNRVPPGVQC